MMDKKISILTQNAVDFESPEKKNQFIRASDTEWIGFADGDVTDKEELCGILEANAFLMDYDVILFGKDVPEGECDCMGLLEHPQCSVYALLFRKKLLVYTGSYNRFLTGNCNYEFLLRLAERGSVYSIPCSAEKAAEFHPVTMAYIVRRYMEVLKSRGRLDGTFLRIVHAAERSGVSEEFNKAMNTFLTGTKEYDRICTDTAPCLILVIEDECYGVIADFADSLADALVELGQAVITTDDRYGDYSKMPTELILNQNYKAIIGFQAAALESEMFHKMKGQRYQFWFDNPMLSIDFFGRASKQTVILCQDEYYARFIREHYAIEKAVQFPPAGKEAGTGGKNGKYDVVFVGSYISLPRPDYEDSFSREFYEYMSAHVDCTIDRAVKQLWLKRGVQYDEQRFMQQIEKLRGVCFDLLQSYRHRVVESIVSAGIQLHVFGDSWRKYQGRGSENLVIHPQVIGEEALHVWAQAKIGLNIMNGHKGGMTERIANIMLCGACCLSDETSYLKEHFRDGGDIVLYRGDGLDQLPEKIRYLLEHDGERERIAMAGHEKALCEHTWRKRAEELLEIINDEERI